MDYLELKGFWNPSTYSGEKWGVECDSIFGTHCKLCREIILVVRGLVKFDPAVAYCFASTCLQHSRNQIQIYFSAQYKSAVMFSENHNALCISPETHSKTLWSLSGTMTCQGKSVCSANDD